ncbi:OmpH family outer membrane protein [Ornithobacterium rhinotracheale]|uniref:OmpH family outer membrane protein n=1 Tax=Ornithobacterium rhinotracheale TaxID=28251 RepID=UPI00129CA173|nr:OmpH family outer membrane protein [Ornithobacterium rhinotracheale]MRJ07658.1 OmpH family outer membrane protein [Ornithobacterium rhinotracheale]MRJ10293.1 OmpH family outer membrane protein [Ornithobacterium rhinotracheale]UOH78254.1 OmpH family outer membrane protein [Ornithobacterium rhinotracheale]
MLKFKFFSLLFFLSVVTFAQRFGYVDTDYVLSNLPAYANAQKQLENQALNWAKEIENQQGVLEQMSQELETERILLPKEKVQEREAKINEKREEIKKLQLKRYGPNGDMFNARKNLVKPIQDQIYNAVDKVAKRRNYSFVFDKANGDLIMIYSDPKFDISEEVLKTLAPDLKTSKGQRQNNYNKSKNKNEKINLKQ